MKVTTEEKKRSMNQKKDSMITSITLSLTPKSRISRARSIAIDQATLARN